jgi:hypothetical protein
MRKDVGVLSGSWNLGELIFLVLGWEKASGLCGEWWRSPCMQARPRRTDSLTGRYWWGRSTYAEAFHISKKNRAQMCQIYRGGSSNKTIHARIVYCPCLKQTSYGDVGYDNTTTQLASKIERLLQALP